MLERYEDLLEHNITLGRQDRALGADLRSYLARLGLLEPAQQFDWVGS